MLIYFNIFNPLSLSSPLSYLMCGCIRDKLNFPIAHKVNKNLNCVNKNMFIVNRSERFLVLR